MLTRLKRAVPVPAKKAIRRSVRRVAEGARRSPAPPPPPTTPSAGFLSYDGLCTICGVHGSFASPADSLLAARAFPCPSCSATVRFRNEAAVIIDELGRGRHISLSTLLDDETVSSQSFYNTGIAGPVRGRLRALSNYVESHYWDDGMPGEERDGFMHQDLHALTFSDESFDVITSSHVLEHVVDPERAFAELFRVLRPGGRLIFSVPVPWPPAEASLRRASIVDGEVRHIEEAVYHTSPGGTPSLVFTDFGTDLLDTLEANGFVVRQQRPHMSIELAYRDSVFVGIKPKKGSDEEGSARSVGPYPARHVFAR